MAGSEPVHSLLTIFLKQPPSCLEFCPTAPNYLVIGTYLLQETKLEDSESPQQTKTGSVQLFQLDPKTPSLLQIQRIPLPHAVFDLHFSPRNPSIFAIATSAASVSLFRVQTSHDDNNKDAGTCPPHPKITPLQTISVHDDPTIPVLYLAWAPPAITLRRDASTDAFAVCFSDGQISIFNTNPPNYEFSTSEMSERQLLPTGPAIVEVWYVAFHSIHGNEAPLLFSGDDFGCLTAHEFSADRGDWTDGEFPLESLKTSDRGRYHGAGVTAILPLYSNETGTVLLTGSYDENIRVVHRTAAGKWEVFAEKSLGGGVWRLKCLDSQPSSVLREGAENEHSYLILASCMHAGTRVLRVSCLAGGESGSEDNTWEIEILHEFTEHESMNYASDVFRGNAGPGRQGSISKDLDLLVVSSSFYDMRVCVWKAGV
ncbi:hypothetical protein AJ80_02076 [Polytolypa hystricis UAMH7299]|uniref:Uncharacterized protein n=1 Tax=Polytolypa hystricis (strain UAMH7299) TaxID=1447883 RepID=A0A2B7YSG6_POLH7|nr:hypothetical protein AJ80_02076 [Polytolypa hystricis UAMH7299]